MSIIVQKFGGTSVADAEKIQAAARKAIRAQQRGHQVVMVVSAMGKNTDALLELAGQLHENPPSRELDMLLSTGEQVSVALVAMAIDALGCKAVSLTGGQIGVLTDNSYGRARIQSIAIDRMKSFLDEGNIVIAAGFQGVDEEMNITTLGRGGSDTTAVALAAVLGAEACEIYTDVDGVYTTDPRLLPEARRADMISYDEMLELASLGAGVMHNRSIEFAKKFGVPIHVRSSFSDAEGTMIVAVPESETAAVCGAAMTRDEARVTVLGIPDVPGTSLEVFSAISDRKIAIDMIVQNIGAEGQADISFTVQRSDLQNTLEAVHEAAANLGALGVTYDDEVSKVSVVGCGMAKQPGVAHRMFRALANAGVNIEMITTSEIKISVLVRRDQSITALRAVHNAFQLVDPPVDKRSWEQVRSRQAAPSNLDSLLARAQETALEELMLTGIALTEGEARMTLRGVPDVPGIAADLFESVADAGIFVDMIVQGIDGEEGWTSVSLTVRQEDLAHCLDVGNRLAEKHQLRGVQAGKGIAKLTVSGIGLRSHTSVGTLMFKTLADAGINVQMINTSELQVNAVVDETHGKLGLDKLNDAFANVLQ
ncbi:MAG: aspartate kinase [Pirellulaceae bacterium]